MEHRRRQGSERRRIRTGRAVHRRRRRSDQALDAGRTAKRRREGGGGGGRARARSRRVPRWGHRHDRGQQRRARAAEHRRHSRTDESDHVAVSDRDCVRQRRQDHCHGRRERTDVRAPKGRSKYQSPERSSFRDVAISADGTLALAEARSVGLFRPGVARQPTTWIPHAPPVRSVAISDDRTSPGHGVRRRRACLRAAVGGGDGVIAGRRPWPSRVGRRGRRARRTAQAPDRTAQG